MGKLGFPRVQGKIMGFLELDAPPGDKLCAAKRQRSGK